MDATSENLSDLVGRIAYLHVAGFLHSELHDILKSYSENLSVNSGRIFDDWIRINFDSQISEQLKIREKRRKEIAVFLANNSVDDWLNRVYSLLVYGGQRIRFVSNDSDEFPVGLRKIYDPPCYISVVGTLHPHKVPISVVGSRACSFAGESNTRTFVSSLRRSNFSIVSGGALGIDSIAHSAAIESGIHTVAVLGNGVEFVYPSTNAELFEDIVRSGGAIVSHFPIGTLPARYTFPQRNVIISGWSVGVLVAEAREKSGSLITAQLAAEQGRLVYAFPYDVSRLPARGGNLLIRDGCAQCVLESRDIIEECIRAAGLLGILGSNENNAFAYQKSIGEQKNTDKHREERGAEQEENGVFGETSFLPGCGGNDEQTILKVISHGPCTVDMIAGKIEYGLQGNLMLLLGKMEISGIIRRNIFGMYELV